MLKPLYTIFVDNLFNVFVHDPVRFTDVGPLVVNVVEALKNPFNPY